MSARTGWFIAGLVLVSLMSMYTPRLAGGVVILLAAVLAVEAAKKGLV